MSARGISIVLTLSLAVLGLTVFLSRRALSQHDGKPHAAEQAATEVQPEQVGNEAPQKAAAQNPAAKPGTPVEAAGTQGRVIVRTAPSMSAEEVAFAKTLRPRAMPAKEPLHVPEGKDLKLAVKFADHLKGRADQNGRLVLNADDGPAMRALASLAETHHLKFQRVHTVEDEKIEALTRRAAEKTGEAQADLAGMIEVKMPSPTREKQVALAKELHALSNVEWVELEALDNLPPPPAEDMAPPTPSLIGFQSYRSAQTGVDIDYVWSAFGIRGHAGLRITDCEYDLNLEHEDLAGLVNMQTNVVSRYTGFGMGHGTSVLGIMASAHNGYGTSGGAPDCEYWFYPESATITTGSQSRAACVLAAITASNEGDIVVLEMQTGGPAEGSNDYVPAEWNQSVWNSVKAGSNAGVVTVAAAGNGNQNLDDALFAAYNARGDSGAIIVGAGTSARVKQGFSTYGSRVDVQAWGSGVFTTSSITSGTYVYGADARQSYTAGFSGTSSATPIVASAAALLQSTARKICEVNLTPAEIRHLLKTTGRAQTGDTTAAIGPLPNLKDATDALFALHPPQLDSLASWGHYHLATAEPDLTADNDGDGSADLLEYLFATDPAKDLPEDATHKPHLSAVTSSESGKVATFDFHQPQDRTGVSWEVQKSTSLRSDSWQQVIHGVGGATIVRNGDDIRVTVPQGAGEDRLFLRVRAWVNPPAGA